MISLSFPRLRIVVLAAGLSTRLGRPKAFARVHGLSLLRRTLKVAASLHAAQIIAVVPSNAARYRVEARGIKVIQIVNSRRSRGLSSSVHRGIAKARYSPAVLLMPIDMVNLKSSELARLLARRRAFPRCVIARRIGRNGASPLILPRWLYPRALQVAGDIGLRELIAQLPAANRVLVEIPSAASDIDTSEDLKAARQSFRRQCFGP
jgi:molybdenum cofactor cytidylyltransferase